MLSASLILLVLMGSRQAQGLFLSPINTATQIGIVPLSLALALGHFFWGFIQPIAGWIADKYGSRRVLVAGILLYSTGLILTTFSKNAPVLIFSLGFISAIGAGAASFSVLIGSVNQHVPENKRGLAAGIINAGSSLGQFIFAPLSQFFITSYGWQGAMLIVSAIAAITAVLVIPLSNKQLASEKALNISQQGLRSTIFPAFRNKSYILLHMGFFTCGFHIAFLSTHLPGEVQLCGQSATVASWALGIIGLSNVVGSLTIGWLTQFFRSKFLLAIMYGSRALLIFVYLLVPKTELTFFLFSIGLGFTWLATVPPTANIVGKLFGVRYLSTLFGLTLVTHQIGAFLGAYLGGIVIETFGSFHVMWYADAALAIFAALLCLPITESLPRYIERTPRNDSHRLNS
ncbi:MAG: MFS transporter [Burkholderiales bacterium]